MFGIIQPLAKSSKSIYTLDISSEESKEKAKIKGELPTSPSTSIPSFEENQECSSFDEPIVFEDSKTSPPRATTPCIAGYSRE